MILEQLTTKLELNILIEKILAKNGAYKTPETKEEALSGIKLTETTKATLKTLKNAVTWLNLQQELIDDYRKKTMELEHDIYKLSVENSKLRTKVNLADQRTNNITEYIELHKNK